MARKAATLGDVYHLKSWVEFECDLSGCGNDFIPQLETRIRAIGEAVCRDLGVKSIKEVGIGMDTPLGEEARKAFANLKRWLTKNKIRR
ncbi:MAG: hypothetical protein Q7R86_02715 [bacterium]|nr:hypothetical protein [bacterium]